MTLRGTRVGVQRLHVSISAQDLQATAEAGPVQQRFPAVVLAQKLAIS